MARSTTRFRYRSVAAAVALGVVAVAIAAISLRPLRPANPSAALSFAFKKGDPDEVGAGENKRALMGPKDARWPEYSAEVEAYLLRAYPGAEVPGEATTGRHTGWAAMKTAHALDGAWELIGPSKATYPAVLNPFLFDGAPYVAGGRVTAMALRPACTPGSAGYTLRPRAAACGAPRKRSAGPNWEYVSGSFGDQRHRFDADGSERSVRQHAVCRHRRAERVG